MSKPHKHADVIKAWADGAEIQIRVTNSPEWLDCVAPNWDSNIEYRVKPKTHKWQKEMDAYVDGKPVQWRSVDPKSASYYWHDMAPGKLLSAWMWDETKYEYRIKPESVEQFLRVSQGTLSYLSHAEKANLKLSFEDGILVKAEVLKC